MGGGFLPLPSSGFPNNNSEAIKAVILAFYSIQSLFRESFAKFGISNLLQSPDIGQNSDGGFPNSGFLVSS